tara:strand:+ start:754 stop:1926 length:1173 start_codon:yes stop_codon:yes gene_type:complete
VRLETIESIHVADRFRKDLGAVEDLATSIHELGLLQPIGITADKLLVFGHRRLIACRDVLGWTEIPARVIDVPSLLRAEHDENELRKDFTPSERVAIAEAVSAELGERRGGDQSKRKNICIRSDQAAAECAGFGNETTYRQAARVVGRGADELREAMDSGAASISAASEVARLPQNEQRQIVAKGEKEILAAAKAIRAERASERRHQRLTDLASIPAGTPDLPDSNHCVIYVDPPWRYEHAVSVSREIENQYPTMSQAQLRDLPVETIANKDAVLLMWATSPKLAEAIDLIDAWGFSYRTCLVWVKDKIGMGYYARQRHELLLVAIRGRGLPAPEPADRPDSVIDAARGQHSAKPHLYDLIERMYPRVSKIELFSRAPQDGWASWGNQAA